MGELDGAGRLACQPPSVWVGWAHEHRVQFFPAAVSLLRGGQISPPGHRGGGTGLSGGLDPPVSGQRVLVQLFGVPGPDGFQGRG